MLNMLKTFGAVGVQNSLSWVVLSKTKFVKSLSFNRKSWISFQWKQKKLKSKSN